MLTNRTKALFNLYFKKTCEFSFVHLGFIKAIVIILTGFNISMNESHECMIGANNYQSVYYGKKNVCLDKHFIM